jgi:hypothetical protein
MSRRRPLWHDRVEDDVEPDEDADNRDDRDEDDEDEKLSDEEAAE